MIIRHPPSCTTVTGTGAITIGATMTGAVMMDMTAITTMMTVIIDPSLIVFRQVPAHHT